MRLAWTRTFRILLITVALVVLGTESGAFEIDSHYYLTFGFALGTCFDWDDAHLIASGDHMLDQNRTTVGEMNPLRTRNKRMWHAFGHSEEDLNRLWFRAVRETHPDLRLVKLGQFLHFLQDWMAHTGFPRTIGHATATITGRDPDSFARFRGRSTRMVIATLAHLAKMCAVMGRLPGGIQDPDIGMLKMTEWFRTDRLMTDLYEQSSTRWRRPRGKLNRQGRNILAKNRLRIEQFIDRTARAQPEKKVPADFQPGDEEHGIPPPLRLRFDREGELTESLDRAIATAKELEAKDLDPADDELTLERAVRVEDGWQVRVRVTNVGDIRSRAGELRVGAYDALTGERLGEEVSSKIPPLKPGQTVTIETLIRTSRAAKEEIITIMADVDDLSMINDQLWFMTQEDIAELQEDLDALGRPADGSLLDPPVEAVELVGEPKLWLYEEWLVAVITARTNLRRPTEELALPTIRLRHENKQLLPYEAFVPQVWIISVLGEGVRPAAKIFLDVRLSQICEMAELGPSSPVLEFTVVAVEARKQRRRRRSQIAPEREVSPRVTEVRTSVKLDDALTEKLHRICTFPAPGSPVGAQGAH